MLIYLGLGSNVGDSFRHLQFAIGQLSALPNIKNLQKSSIYKSQAIEVIKKQNDFLNMVVVFEFPESQNNINSAQQLLKYLLEIEINNGRKRPYFHAPRTLDLDLLIYGEIKCNLINVENNLILPHPRICERLFVLMPLVEILNQNEKINIAKQINIKNLDEQVDKLSATQICKIFPQPSQKFSLSKD